MTIVDYRCFIATIIPLRDALYRVAYYILESEEDAQDALQDLYVKLWSMRESLDAVSNPKAWCVTMMRNLCLDRIRKSSGLKMEPVKEWLPAREDTSADLISKETLDKVMSAVERLPESQRTVLKLRVFEGLSYEEVEARTGMNNLTLRVQLSQARRKLRKEL